MPTVITALVGGLVGAFALQLGYRGFRSRVHGRTFSSVRGPPLTLVTGLGRYRFDPAARRIWIAREGRPEAFVRLDDVRGVQVRVGYRTAMLEELLFEGWSFADLREEYRDHRMTWDVVLTTCHGLVPVAALTQYRKRDWFDFATPVHHAILGKLGLYRDGADVAEEIEQHVRQALQACGLNIRGGYTDDHAAAALAGAPVPTDHDLVGPPQPPPARVPLAVDLPEAPDNDLWPTASGRSR